MREHQAILQLTLGAVNETSHCRRQAGIEEWFPCTRCVCHGTILSVEARSLHAFVKHSDPAKWESNPYRDLLFYIVEIPGCAKDEVLGVHNSCIEHRVVQNRGHVKALKVRVWIGTPALFFRAPLVQSSAH
jgi:hypothetical protein